MSGDLEPAIAAGATHVRVGSAVLGPRPHGRVVSHTADSAPSGRRGSPEDSKS